MTNYYCDECDVVIASAVWERLETTGSAPSAQSSSAVLYDKKLITLGGIINGVAQNCLHFLNLGQFT